MAAGNDILAWLQIADGSDCDSIGAWPKKSIPDKQLGPNRNGQHW